MSPGEVKKIPEGNRGCKLAHHKAPGLGGTLHGRLPAVCCTGFFYVDATEFNPNHGSQSCGEVVSAGRT